MAKNTFYFRMIGSQGGQLCYTNLEFQTISETPSSFAPTAQEWLDAWWAENEVLLLACLSEDFTVERLEGRLIYGDTLVSSYGTLILGDPGAVADQALPVFVTASFIKWADPFDQEGAAPTDIKRGRLSLSGIPEAFQDNGVAIPAAVTTLQNLANNLLTLTIGDQAYEMRIFRLPDGPGPALKNARVQTVQFSRIGTQNTRKY